MACDRDGAGHQYEEFDTSAQEIRLTYIPHQDWANGPTIRTQERAFTGRVSVGPEFPAHLADEPIRALRQVQRS
jgi:hypothetical protein